MTQRIIGWFALAAAAGLLVYLVLMPPAIGLADNGDFEKVTRQFGLRAPYDATAPQSAYIHTRYEFFPVRWKSGFSSTETLLAGLVARLNRTIHPDRVLDIRWMGVVHGIFFVLAFALFVPVLGRASPVVQALLLALAIFIFCDAMYATYFNSFYMDAAAFVFLMPALVLFTRAVRARGERMVEAWAAVLFALLMLTAKTQHALLAIPLMVFVVWQRRALWGKRTLAASAIAVTLMAGAAAYSLTEGSPPGYANPCLFSMICGRLLPNAPNASAELASLGLDDSFATCVGMLAYDEDAPMKDPEWAEQFLSRVSFPGLAKFYITHPARALMVARMALQEGAEQRPPNLGNYDKSAGNRPGSQSDEFAFWSEGKKELLLPLPWLCPLIFAVAVAIVGWRCPAAGVALGLAGIIEFGISGMTDSAEVTRHLFFFNLLWDVSVFAATCSLALWLDGWRSARAAATDREQPHATG